MINKKIDKSKLVVGLIPFIIYLILSYFGGGLRSAGTSEPHIYTTLYFFFDFCKVFWPSTIFGVVFLILSFFPKKDKKNLKNNKN